MCSGIRTHGHMHMHAASQVQGSQQISTALFQWFNAKGTRTQPGSEQSLMDRVKETKSEISDLGLTSSCKVQGDVQWMRRRWADNATAGILWQENNRCMQCDFGAAGADRCPRLSEAKIVSTRCRTAFSPALLAFPVIPFQLWIFSSSGQATHELLGQGEASLTTVSCWTKAYWHLPSVTWFFTANLGAGISGRVSALIHSPFKAAFIRSYITSQGLVPPGQGWGQQKDFPDSAAVCTIPNHVDKQRAII